MRRQNNGRSKLTRALAEDMINDLSEIPEPDKKSNGGRIPDNAKYGTWLRKNDPVAFEVAFNELEREQ